VVADSVHVSGNGTGVVGRGAMDSSFCDAYLSVAGVPIATVAHSRRAAGALALTVYWLNNPYVDGFSAKTIGPSWF